MRTLIIINDPPYDTERLYNAERMVKRVTTRGNVLLCGTCMDARGLTDEDVVKGAERSTMDALAEATEQAHKVLVF